MPYRHIPVMQREVLQYLNCRSGKTYVDGTLGGAGHARSILEKIGPRGLLIAIDQDIEAIENAEESLKAFKTKIRLFRGNFAQLPDALSQFGIDGVDGILLDLGLSLHQIKASGRGFSFQLDEPLDMRMNIETKETAADIINHAPEQALKKIFKSYGEERWSGKIAKKIVAERSREAIGTSKKLAEIVMAAIPRGPMQRQRIHPATRVFMALRIAVNKELERLEAFMDVAFNLLNPAGRNRASTAVGNQERKLVATDSRDDVTGSHQPCESLGHLDERRIAGLMPERVVDELESIQADEHDRELAVGRRATGVL